MYVPTSDYEADMHFIINGEDQGPCVKRIPFMDAPLHVVVDVYGATTKVRIVQLYGGKWVLEMCAMLKVCFLLFSVPTLQAACRDAILQHITKKAVSALPLPKLLKEYLLYEG